MWACPMWHMVSTMKADVGCSAVSWQCRGLPHHYKRSFAPYTAKHAPKHPTMRAQPTSMQAQEVVLRGPRAEVAPAHEAGARGAACCTLTEQGPPTHVGTTQCSSVHVLSSSIRSSGDGCGAVHVNDSACMTHATGPSGKPPQRHAKLLFAVRYGMYTHATSCVAQQSLAHGPLPCPQPIKRNSPPPCGRTEPSVQAPSHPQPYLWLPLPSRLPLRGTPCHAMMHCAPPFPLPPPTPRTTPPLGIGIRAARQRTAGAVGSCA